MRAILPEDHRQTAVLVTGASGFVDAALMRYLQIDGRRAIAAICTVSPNARRAPDLSVEADEFSVLQAIDVVMDTVAPVHVMNEKAAHPLAAWRAANVDGTLTLAHQAASAGARSFIFISSIKRYTDLLANRAIEVINDVRECTQCLLNGRRGCNAALLNWNTRPRRRLSGGIAFCARVMR